MTYIHSRRDVLLRGSALALVAPVLGLAAVDLADSRHGSFTLAGPTMGTGYSVTIADPPADLVRSALKDEVEESLEAVNDQMSNWRAHSEISRFNAERSDGWVSVSPDTLGVVEEALHVGRISDGAFDPTIGPLVDLWGFGPRPAERRVPRLDHIDAALETTGLRQIRTRTSPPAVAKDRAALEIDLCSIAKGFGVDRLARLLDNRGVHHYLIEIGGEVRARGYSPKRQPWRIGIEKPIAGQRAVKRVVALEGESIATSGNYRNFFESDGLRYSHIIDPRTGAPTRHRLASVTVIAPTAMQADALSTALMVLGPDAGWELARCQGLAALFIVKDGNDLVEVGTSEFESYRVG